MRGSAAAPLLEVRAALDDRAQARLALDARERGSDADLDPLAEADVLGRIRPSDIEDIGLREHARVAISALIEWFGAELLT